MNILSVDLDYFGNRGFKNNYKGIDVLMDLIYDNDPCFVCELHHKEMGVQYEKCLSECPQHEDITLTSYDFHDDLAYNETENGEYDDNCWLGDILKLNDSRLKKVSWRCPNKQICIDDGEGLCQIAVEERTNPKFDKNNPIQFYFDKVQKLIPDNVDFIREEKAEFDLNDLESLTPKLLFVCISEEYVKAAVIEDIVWWYTKKCHSLENVDELKNHPNLINFYHLCTQVLTFRRSFNITSYLDLIRNNNLFKYDTKALNIGNNKIEYKESTDHNIYYVEALDYNHIDRGFVSIGELELQEWDTYEGALYNWILEAFTSEQFYYATRLGFRLVNSKNHLIKASINAKIYDVLEKTYLQSYHKVNIDDLILF